MSDIQPDPLAELLAPRPAGPPDSGIFRQTVPILRHRRQLRKLAGLVTLLTAYAAGLLTTLACIPPGNQAPAPRWAPVVQMGPAEVADTLPGPDPVKLEWQAVDHPQKAGESYRQAGDAYLDHADLANAVRAYGNALDEDRTAGTDLSAGDTWLLLAIKHARKKESEGCR